MDHLIHSHFSALRLLIVNLGSLSLAWCNNFLDVHILTAGSFWDYQAFDKAGMGGWKLVGIMKPDTVDVEGGVV